MERTLFLKILFKNTLKAAAYVSALALILAMLYWVMSHLGINPAVRIIFLACAILLTGLIYYLTVREPPKEIVAEDNPVYAAELLSLLRSGHGKEELKEKIPLLIQKSRKTTLFPLVNDLSCHVGHFIPTTHDYRFRNRVFSFDEGLNYYVEKLEAMLAMGKFVFDEPIYELYWRWIHYKGDKVEVEYICSNQEYERLSYYLFKSIHKEDYYFDVERGYSAFSSFETVKVTDEALQVELAKAVQNNDRYTIGQIADRFLARSADD